MTRKQIFENFIAAAPKVAKERYLKDFDRLKFNDEADFYAYLDEIRPDIEAMAAAQTTGAQDTTTAAKGNGNGAMQAAVKERIAEQQAAAQAAPPAIMGLPANPESIAPTYRDAIVNRGLVEP